MLNGPQVSRPPRLSFILSSALLPPTGPGGDSGGGSGGGLEQQLLALRPSFNPHPTPTKPSWHPQMGGNFGFTVTQEAVHAYGTLFYVFSSQPSDCYEVSSSVQSASARGSLAGQGWFHGLPRFEDGMAYWAESPSAILPSPSCSLPLPTTLTSPPFSPPYPCPPSSQNYLIAQVTVLPSPGPAYQPRITHLAWSHTHTSGFPVCSVSCH